MLAAVGNRSDVTFPCQAITMNSACASARLASDVQPSSNSLRDVK